jgi:hypothetical protein
MTDFEKLLRHGLDAAKQSQRARIEIANLIETLDAEVNKVSEGAARLQIATRSEFVDAGPGLAKFASFLQPKRDYKAIVISHRRSQEFNTTEIARWRQDPYGYPVWIGAHGSENACGDLEALERALGKLVSSPSAGEAILAAMSFRTAAEKLYPGPGQANSEGDEAGDALGGTAADVDPQQE